MLEMTVEPAHLIPACVNHPEVETRLTCSSCGDPICPRCMVSTVVGQKCPRCARQSAKAKGTPDSVVLLRGLGAGFAVAALGALLVLKLGLFAFLLAIGYGFLVAEAVRWGARRRVHTRLGVVAVVAVALGLGGVAMILGVPLLAPRVLIFFVLGGGTAFIRASGIW